jgi:hypothetical protein
MRILAAVFGLATASVLATDYYVSPSGNDGNSGTSPASPWKTIAKVNSFTFSAGDRVHFQGGQTFNGELEFEAADAGTSSNPITVTSYGTGYATINAGAGTGILVYNTGGYVISDLNLVGGWNSTTQTGNSGSGISFYTDITGALKLPHIRVENVEVSGFKEAGISIGAWPSDNSMSGYDDVLITDCIAHDNGDVGITTWGILLSSATTYAHTNVTVFGCVAYNNRGIVNKGHHSGSGIILGGVDGGLIERCLAYNNGELNNYASAGPVGIWTYDSNAITIQYCESHSNKTGTGTPDGGGFDLDGGVTNSVVQYNYSHDNYGPGFMLYQYSGARPSLSNNVLRYNVSENDGRKRNYGAIYIAGGSAVKNNRIYNNTVYMTKPGSGNPAPFKAGTTGTGNSVRNNSFSVSGAIKLVETSGTNVTFQGNNYWSGTSAFSVKYGSPVYSSLAAWRAGSGQETLGGVDTGSTVDPLLTNAGGGGAIDDPYQLDQLTAYKLQTTSPLKDAGLDLATLFGWNVGSQDYYGNPLPQGGAYDVGAHELSSALFAQNLNHSSVLSDYVSGAPTTGQFHNIQTYNVGTGSPPVPEFWSIAGGRLQLQRDLLTNPSGFTRTVMGGINPTVVRVKFKLRVSAGNSSNTFGDLATLDVGNITAVTGYNFGTSGTSVGHRILIKGAGAGKFRLRLNTNPVIDSPSYNYNGGSGTPLDVEWVVNTSGSTVNYTGPGGTESRIKNACDVFVDGKKVHDDAARNTGFTGSSLGGFRFRATVSKSVSTDPDIVIDFDDIEVTPLN